MVGKASGANGFQLQLKAISHFGMSVLSAPALGAKHEQAPRQTTILQLLQIRQAGTILFPVVQVLRSLQNSTFSCEYPLQPLTQYLQ